MHKVHTLVLVWKYAIWNTPVHA